ncbi:MAG: head GIN domain-containing protein [Bacteroidales bacterium]|nr:head GIN domain-containing protein [Bacteroidales bacterium]
MKTLKLTLAGMMLLTLTYTSVKAQTKGNGDVTTQERQVPAFEAIKVGCAINLYISQGDKQIVKVVTDENLQDRITTKVTNGTLSLSCDNIKDASKMNVYVTAVNLSKIDASSASKVTGETVLKSEVFGLYTSGAAKTTLTIETGTFNNETSGAANNILSLTAKTVNTEVSGAGNLSLKGSAENHKTEVSGAGSLKALEFITDNTDANVSGAGNAKIMARKLLKADLSGVGNITYFDKDNVKKISKQGQYQITFDGMDNVKSVIIEDDNEETEITEAPETVWNVEDANDTVTIVLNDKRIVVVTDDTVKVNLGQRDYVISDNGVKINKHDKKPKFNGHWAGFDLSVNGLLNSSRMINNPENYPYFDLNYSKSLGVSINFFEQNVNLYHQHWGLVTGLGLTWNNYRFANNIEITENGMLEVVPNLDPTKTYEKSKLMVASLRVPLLLEYQTNSKMKANSFHISGGVVGSARTWSHTKIKVDGSKVKDKGDFYINPFRADAMATLGWGVINLYGTYAITEMFRHNKGPEVYPFEIGITLVGF